MNRERLRFARTRAYIAGMDREYWVKKLREAEAELEAARTRTDVNAAAKKLQRAKAELKEIESDQAAVPRRRSKGRARSAGASS